MCILIPFCLPLMKPYSQELQNQVDFLRSTHPSGLVTLEPTVQGDTKLPFADIDCKSPEQMVIDESQSVFKVFDYWGTYSRDSDSSCIGYQQRCWQLNLVKSIRVMILSVDRTRLASSVRDPHQHPMGTHHAIDTFFICLRLLILFWYFFFFCILHLRVGLFYRSLLLYAINKM